MRAGQAGSLPRPPRAGSSPPLHTTMKRPSAASSPAFSAGAPAALLAVRPTATACGRGARPERPGSWGLQAAPYAPPLRGRAPPLPPLAVRPAQTTAALQENNERAEQLRPVLLTRGTLATASVLQAGSGNMAGNSAKRGTGQHGRFPFPKFLRAALPGRSGPAMRHSLTVRIAYACPAIGGAVRSAQKFWEGKTTFPIMRHYRKLPFPRHIASHFVLT